MEWNQITDESLIDQFNSFLRNSDASIYQFPFWNRALDMRTYKATFHMAGNDDSPIAFACVTTVGIWGFRFALVNHGPVIIQKDLACDAINSFVEYLSEKYVFAKFSPKDAVDEKNLVLLDELNVQRHDSFPF